MTTQASSDSGPQIFHTHTSWFSRYLASLIPSFLCCHVTCRIRWLGIPNNLSLLPTILMFIAIANSQPTTTKKLGYTPTYRTIQYCSHLFLLTRKLPWTRKGIQNWTTGQWTNCPDKSAHLLRTSFAGHVLESSSRYCYRTTSKNTAIQKTLIEDRNRQLSYCNYILLVMDK